MDKDTIKSVLDKFIDDKFTDAEEELKDAFTKDRDKHLATELGLDYDEDEETVDEAWGKKMETPKKEIGKYEGKSLAELKSMKDRPGADKMEINFAIRAKKAGGGKWKGVTAD